MNPECQSDPSDEIANAFAEHTPRRVEAFPRSQALSRFVERDAVSDAEEHGARENLVILGVARTRMEQLRRSA